MCGIVGIVSLSGQSNPEAERLHAMCNSIIHRGPDEEGQEIQDGVALGMRRLSIIDVADGHQPYFNEDRTVRSVFNGEIYNFRELRNELIAKGHDFQAATDGEVIVHLWEEYKTDFASHLNGMFAIAVHDIKEGRVVIVRDRIGIKPLYYFLNADNLVFASEIKALLASGLIPRDLNIDALGQFLAWEYIPGKQTLLKNVYKLEAGNLLDLHITSGKTRLRTWWNIAVSDRKSGEGSESKQLGEWEELIDNKLRECVQRRLVSDVPLGAFLSGGVDSSLIVASMGDAQTFSIGFDDPSYNELEWSKKVASHLGVTHKTEIIRPNIIELFDHLMTFMDDPIGDFSIFPTYLVSRLARQQVTVVLSGDGGDEVFGGYETYVAENMTRNWKRLPKAAQKFIESRVHKMRPRPKKKGLVNKAKRFLEGAAYNSELRHARWRLFVGEAQRKMLFSKSAFESLGTPAEAHILDLFNNTGPGEEIDKLLFVDLKSYLCDNILVKVDRMSMACSLEARVPFLDHELVELAFKMPSHLKVNKNKTKVLLKKIASRYVPENCVYRSKQGFSIPIKNWLKNEFRPLMEELLAPDRIRGEDIFQVDTVEKLKKEHLAGEANHSHILWSLLVFQDWRTRWKV